jgi:NADPH:quinone reductase-like Zn-dependent oxidoreductase
VTGVCSGRTADLAPVFGLDYVIDYTKADFADGTRRYDLVIDVFGRTPVRRLRRALTSAGRLVIAGGEGDRWIGGIQRQLWASLLSMFVRQKLGAFRRKGTRAHTPRTESPYRGTQGHTAARPNILAGRGR